MIKYKKEPDNYWHIRTSAETKSNLLRFDGVQINVRHMYFVLFLILYSYILYLCSIFTYNSIVLE